MKNINVTLMALLLIGFTGFAHGEMGKCSGMQNSNMKNKSGMMQNSESQQQIDKVKQCVNAATTLQEIKNCKIGMMQGMKGNQGMMGKKSMMSGHGMMCKKSMHCCCCCCCCHGMMQGKQGMMNKKGMMGGQGMMENKGMKQGQGMMNN